MFITTGPTSPIDPAERAAMMSAEAEDLNELFDRDNDSQADTQQAPPRGGSHTHTRAHTHARAHTHTHTHTHTHAHTRTHRSSMHSPGI